MRSEDGPAQPRALTGTRIRERRQEQRLRQADLARAVGISASYLNLIEHNRRRIGGKLLNAIARELAAEPAMLSEGPDAALHEALQEAAAGQGIGPGPAPERDRIDAFAGRFPGWAELIAAQSRRIDTLEAVIEGLRDRLAHDPVLAEAMHEVLSTVSAIRATADILVNDPEIDAQWRTRFHRNLHEEAERLAARASAMRGHFEAEGAEALGFVASPLDEVEAFLDAADHHFPQIEREGRGAVEAVVAGARLRATGARSLIRGHLLRYAADAEALPLATFEPAAEAVDFAPEPLLAAARGDAALVLRRLASLPRGVGRPDLGLAVCDASGALIHRRRLPSFSVPRFGAGCPLWPLYRAFARPLNPERVALETPDGTRLTAWAVAQPIGAGGFGADPIMQATMLVRPAPGVAKGDPVERVGPGCQLCPRAACDARRVPNILGTAEAAETRP